MPIKAILVVILFVNRNVYRKMCDIICPICTDDLMDGGSDNDAVSVQCGHLYHNTCLSRWLQQFPDDQKVCPNCMVKAEQVFFINELQYYSRLY